ncbi:MAG: prenyltransferase/squalene oxidase repeat-containing protein [Bryobacteraceae bacterium]
MFSVVLLIALALSPVERAVAYLSKEVPRWRAENGCFSCHNNGDGARALYAAGVSPANAALAETTAWLENPERWDSNRGDPAVSDKKLARIQFGAALLASGRKEPVCAAAAVIAKDRGPDGSWTVDSGSPATYGTALATYYARQVMRGCGLETPLTDAWLAGLKPGNVAEAAAQLLAIPGQAAALDYLRRAQTSDGGWGEYPRMPAQVFDTALVMIALRGQGADEAIAKGRAWLLVRQQAEGGWPETTRPPGSQSYAQHISTTAWATLALLDAER